MDYKIYLPRDVYLDKEITSQEIITYCALYMFGKQSHDEYELVTVDNLLWRIYGEYTVGRKVRQGIIDAIESLTIKKIVYCEQPSKGIYLLKTDQFVATSQFAQISYVAMRKIMTSEYRNKAQAFRYYCILMGSRNGVASNMKLSYFAEAMEVSEKTIMTYNKLLEDLKIIYVIRGNELKNGEDGGIFRDNNIYCAYEDRLQLFSARSMGQKIVQIKNGKKYSSTVMKQISDYVDAHNERELIKKSKNPDYVEYLLTKLNS
ncbi:MAG: hypothetical protein MJ236_04085 [Clostridia bacterium]|nr:hypothetical protein [Clostridia bacterium]